MSFGSDVFKRIPDDLRDAIVAYDRVYTGKPIQSPTTFIAHFSDSAVQDMAIDGVTYLFAQLDTQFKKWSPETTKDKDMWTYCTMARFLRALLAFDLPAISRYIFIAEGGINVCGEFVPFPHCTQKIIDEMLTLGVWRCSTFTLLILVELVYNELRTKAIVPRINEVVDMKEEIPAG